MIAITLDDLRFRMRQFVIAVVGASLVFALSLLMTGMAAGFGAEVDQTVAGTGAAAWVMPQGSIGRITSLSPMPAPVAAAAASLRVHGVTRADPVVVAPEAAVIGDRFASVVVIGSRPGGLGAAPVDTGRQVRGGGQAVVDDRLGLADGRSFSVSGERFTVVGTVSGKTLLGGLPDVYVTLGDAQRVAFGGRPLVDAVLTSSMPSAVPTGFTAMSDAEVQNRTLSQMAPAESSIDNSRAFMWFIATIILAALVYVTALERTRDFAVLKALGASSGSLFLGLALQAVVVSLIAAAIALVVAQFMTGLFAQPVAIPSNVYIVLPVTALAVGLVSSLVALRRAVSVDPAMAFAGG